jgi:hypothetical protein
MAVTDERIIGSTPEHFPELPLPRTLAGPRSRAVMRRTFAAVGVVWAIGAALTAADPSPAATAFGLGLLLPGGGLVYAGLSVAGAVVAVGFVLAFAVFWLLSPLWLPIAVWLASAVWAAALAAPEPGHASARWAVPATLGALVILAAVIRLVSFRSIRREVVSRNTYLAPRTWTPPPREGAPALCPPLSDSDLGFQRYLLDLALQPLGSFDGFATLDQFREAAWRYQLNTLGWSLALAQYTTTPAFSGYLEEAQRNAVTKMLDPRVWRYWRWENLLGNLRWAPDPVYRENIMLSGFFAAHLGAFETATGDTRFNEPGALTFTDRARDYVYDYPSLVGRLAANFADARLCMFPCEPNWVYPHCNELAMTGIVMHDRLHGTDHAGPLRAGFDRAVVEEFATPDDRVLNMRSSRLGLSVPGLAKSTLTEADAAWLLSPLLPAVAARRWELVRRWFRVDGDGRLCVDRIGSFDRIDVGNYKPSLVFMLATIMLAAREMGDEDIYEGARTRIDSDYRIHPDPDLPAHRCATRLDASPFTAMLMTMARFGRRHAWHDLANRGRPAAWTTGPRLAQAPYPEVLVALAVTDGHDLELELVPGGEPGRFVLALDRLRPRATYRITGAGVSAGGDAGPVSAGGDESGRLTVDDSGTGMLTVDLSTRLRLHITPAL